MPRSKSKRRKLHVAKSHETDEKVRSSWRGMVRFGLVSFAVEAINARTPEEAPVRLHQLHAECHNRIRHQKTCPVHGPVSNDEIVSGYEVRKGKYVEISPEELDELRTDRERALTIDAFVAPEEIDVIYFDGRMYYLSPDGEHAREPYAVFLAALKRQKRWGVGQVVFSGREQVVAVRPYEGALQMALLNYAAEIRRPQDAIAAIGEARGSDKKLRLADQLIESWTDDDFDFSRYHDTYAEKMKDLIEAKVSGKKLVLPEVEEEPEVINLMEALKKSIGRQRTSQPASAHASPRGNSRKHPRAKRRHAS
ncbi:MAG: Ku protein [Planctomycetia bacterium]|nr:Ku protein [Planctomycetia bacterium]